MLVWVASYPRSGNTLTLLTIHDVFGIDRIGDVFRDDLRLGRTLHELMPNLPAWEPPPELRELRGDALLEALRDRPEPYFVKTHRLSEASDPAPALYIVRDGRDAIVSHAHFVAERDTPKFRGMSFNHRVATLIHPGVSSYGAWSRNVREWTRRRGPVALLHFEELIGDAPASLIRACEAIEVPLPESDGENVPFESLRKQTPTMFRRGIVGSWRDEMPTHLQERFWRVHGAEMRALGYSA